MVFGVDLGLENPKVAGAFSVVSSLVCHPKGRWLLRGDSGFCTLFWMGREFSIALRRCALHIFVLYKIVQ